MNERIFGWLALLGGAAAIALEFPFAANGWGPPGTAVYARYELLNRLMSAALLLMAAGWLGIWRRPWPRGGRWGAGLALLGAAGMVLGNAAEFWFFSDLPYEGDTLRQAAYTLFSVSGLAFNGGAAWLGVLLWRGRAVPRWCTLLFLFGLPLDIAAFFVLGTPFLAGALLALNAGWLLLAAPTSHKSSQPDRTPAP